MWLPRVETPLLLVTYCTIDMEVCGRYFVHKFPDTGLEESELRNSVTDAIHRIKDKLVGYIRIESREAHRDSVYVGRLGALYALYLQDMDLWRSRLMHASNPSPKPTLIGGTMLTAVLNGNQRELESWAELAHHLPMSECEVLNGRAGCLAGLRMAKRLHPDLNLGTHEQALVHDIIAAGNNDRTDVFSWSWNGKEYLGGIHGMAGIVFNLLQYSHAPEIEGKILHTVDEALQEFTYSSGNMRSSKGSSTDKLVHFCHGATGWIPLLCLLCSRFPDNPLYRVHMRNFGETLWKRGLLATKGPGICHGIGGSICGLVDLYRCTGDTAWLNRAKRFALFLSRDWERETSLADREFSLFEGMAGALYALNLVMQEPTECERESAFATSFPCF